MYQENSYVFVVHVVWKFKWLPKQFLISVVFLSHFISDWRIETHHFSQRPKWWKKSRIFPSILITFIYPHLLEKYSCSIWFAPSADCLLISGWYFWRLSSCRAGNDWRRLLEPHPYVRGSYILYLSVNLSSWLVFISV